MTVLYRDVRFFLGGKELACALKSLSVTYREPDLAVSAPDVLGAVSGSFSLKVDTIADVQRFTDLRADPMRGIHIQPRVRVVGDRVLLLLAPRMDLRLRLRYREPRTAEREILGAEVWQEVGRTLGRELGDNRLRKFVKDGRGYLREVRCRGRTGSRSLTGAVCKALGFDDRFAWDVVRSCDLPPGDFGSLGERAIVLR